MGKLLALSLFALSSLACAQAPFTRTYKVGQTQTYTITMTVHVMGVHTTSIDVSLTPTKLLDSGKAEVKVHWSNLQKEANDTTQLPGDSTMQFGPSGLPAPFKPEQGSVTPFVAVLGIAGATTQKPAEVGQEAPVSWDPGDNSVVFKGTVKVLEIIPDKKQLKTAVNIKPSFGGQEAGDMVFASVIDTTDNSLISSKGTFSLAQQEFTFTRKKS